MIDRYRVLFRLAVLSWAPWVTGWLTGLAVAIAAAVAGFPRAAPWIGVGAATVVSLLALLVAHLIAVDDEEPPPAGVSADGADVYVTCRLCKGAKTVEMHRITQKPGGSFLQGPLETMTCPYCHGEGRLYDVLNSH